jgi:hypothetical protein
LERAPRKTTILIVDDEPGSTFKVLLMSGFPGRNAGAQRRMAFSSKAFGHFTTSRVGRGTRVSRPEIEVCKVVQYWEPEFLNRDCLRPFATVPGNVLLPSKPCCVAHDPRAPDADTGLRLPLRVAVPSREIAMSERGLCIFEHKAQHFGAKDWFSEHFKRKAGTYDASPR